MNKGINLPNRQFDPYTKAELHALEDLKPSTLIWILYDDREGAINMEHKWQLEPYINKYHPRIIYRTYRDDIYKQDPINWTIKCNKLIERINIPGEFIPANEFNLEGFGDDWKIQADWLKEVALQWPKSNRQVVNLIHLPALAPMGDYQAGWEYYHKAGLGKVFDVWDVHIYTMDHSIVPLAYTDGWRVCITEFNMMDPSGVFWSYRDVARDACWFILGGAEDQKKYDILDPRNLPYYNSFRISLPPPVD